MKPRRHISDRDGTQQITSNQAWSWPKTCGRPACTYTQGDTGDAVSLVCGVGTLTSGACPHPPVSRSLIHPRDTVSVVAAAHRPDDETVEVVIDAWAGLPAGTTLNRNVMDR